MKTNITLANLSEQQLLDHFGNLVRRDRRHTAALLAAIAEIDERKLWAKHACPSMFAFCVERFHMSESTAGKRIWAARTARRFPVIFEMIARGELHLSAISKIAKHLTEENHREVLLRARHKSSREIDLLIAELAPRPDAPSRIRAVPRSRQIANPNGSEARGNGSAVRAAVPDDRPRDLASHLNPGAQPAEPGACERTAGAQPAEPGARESTAGAQSPQSGLHSESVATDPSASPRPTQEPASGGRGTIEGRGKPRPRGRVEPLSPRRYKIEITVDQQTHDNLRMLEDLLGHQLASTDPAVIVSRAIDLLLDETLKKKAAITDRARSGHQRSGHRTRAIPAAVRREVWRRDGGRCTFVDRHGRRCRGTHRLEFHHECPYAQGGRHDASNIALRCGAHNQYQADLDYGRDFMRDKRGGNGEHSVGNVQHCT